MHPNHDHLSTDTLGAEASHTLRHKYSYTCGMIAFGRRSPRMERRTGGEGDERWRSAHKPASVEDHNRGGQSGRFSVDSGDQSRVDFSEAKETRIVGKRRIVDSENGSPGTSEK